MKKLTIILTALMVVGLLASNLALAANPPQPTYGTADVEGDPSEWDLAEDGSGDFFANMYRAADTDKPVESKLYLRYDCSTNTLYALVLGVEGVPVLSNLPDDAFIKIGNPSPPPPELKLVDGNSGDDGTPPDFAWVDQGFDGNNNHARGWEGSASLPEGNYKLNVHTQVFDDGEAQTSAVPNREIDLVIQCPETGTIIVVKDAEPESDREFPFTSDIPGHASFSLVDDGSGTNDSQVFPDLTPGSYDVSELVPDGWNLSHIDCVDPDRGSSVDAATASIDLDSGETVVCTFTNEAQPGTIIIKKVTDPEGGEGFSFADNIAAPNSFTLGDGGMQTFNDVTPGSYAVTEDDPLATPGQDDKGQFYDLVDLVCEDSDAEGTASTVDLGFRQANINLDPGETVTCTFTNEKQKPSAIRLIEDSFAVQAGAGSSVTIAWETGTEIDNVGYNLYRATSANGPWARINDTLITAQGDALFGASYSFVDRPGRGTFYYRLEDVDYYGVSTLYDPVVIDLGPAIRAPWFRPSLPEF